MSTLHICEGFSDEAVRNCFKIPCVPSDCSDVDFFLTPERTCILYTRLTWYILAPDDLQRRCVRVGRGFVSRILVVYVDDSTATENLASLNRSCSVLGFTLVAAFTVLEVALYVEALVNSTHKRSLARVDLTHSSRVSSVLSSIKAVSKNEALSLQQTFSSLARALCASEQRLRAIPGMGVVKSRHFLRACHYSFRSSTENC
jgi:hypothetical protein